MQAQDSGMLVFLLKDYILWLWWRSVSINLYVTQPMNTLPSPFPYEITILSTFPTIPEPPANFLFQVVHLIYM